MRPEPVVFDVLPCPVCREPLDEDDDGTSCDHCGGLLVPRVWADRCLPAMGRPALPPVFLPTARDVTCPSCKRAMAPVLCHGVSSWSCARCRWLFFEGLRHREIVDPLSLRPFPMPPPQIGKPSLLAVVAEHSHTPREIAQRLVGAAVVIAAVVAMVLLAGL